MIPEILQNKLEGNKLPINLKQLEEEKRIALAKGYNVPEVNYHDGIYTKQQAEEKLNKIGLSSSSLFYKFFSTYRFFPIGNGEELYNLNLMQAEEGYLQLSSPEGEGSYFYQISTDAVFDVGWGDKESLVSGNLDPKWTTFQEFLSWYYN
jgi:hypothetical protein